MKYLYILLFPMMLDLSCNSDNSQIPDKIDYNFYNSWDIIHLSWKDKLTEYDINSIFNAIDSNYSHRYGFENLMIPLLVHRIAPNSQGHSNEYWKFFMECFNNTIDISDDEYDEYLFNKIDTSKLISRVEQLTTHYQYWGDDLLKAIIIRHCKKIRNGEIIKYKIPNNFISEYSKSLISYSKIKKSTAIDSLINTLLKDQQESINKKYNSINILTTYGKEATEKVFQILLNPTQVNSKENLGISNLFWHLTGTARINLSSEQHKEMVEFLNHENQLKGTYSNYKAYIASLTSELTGEDLEICQNRVGIYR